MILARRPRESERPSVSPLRRSRGPSVGRSQNQPRRRFRPGDKALREIVKYQQSTDMLIPRLPFQRLVKSVTDELCPENKKKYTAEAMHVLQLAVEDYLTGLLEDAYLCALHAKRVTMVPKDLMLARRIRGVTDPGNR